MSKKQSDKVILAADQRLSQSLLWEIQRQYFLKNGMRAWQDDVVPHDISSNPYMARTYAQLVLGYLRDCVAAASDGSEQIDPEQSLTIVELGSGSGRLAYHFLHQFYPRYWQAGWATWPIKLVMTDFVPETIAFWQAHERFKPWVEAGVLDFALFDVRQARPLHLIHADTVLSPDQIQNPVILLANYFFDSIPQDSFVIEDGQLCANLLTLNSTQPEPDLADPAIWERLELSYEAIPLPETGYEEAMYDQILDGYAAHLPDTTLTFPNVGLDCLRFWKEYSGQRLLLLTSDRGVAQAEALVGQGNPMPNLHGSFSLMVNYHALSQYVLLAGGQVFQSSHYQDNLQVLAYTLGLTPNDGMETGFAFTDAVINGGPDDFFALKQAMETVYSEMTLPQLLSFLRLSAWDAAVFRDCFPYLRRQVAQAPPAWYADIHETIVQIWSQYLPLREDDDLAHLLGELWALIGRDPDTILRRSQIGSLTPRCQGAKEKP